MFARPCLAAPHSGDFARPSMLSTSNGSAAAYSRKPSSDAPCRCFRHRQLPVIRRQAQRQYPFCLAGRLPGFLDPTHGHQQVGLHGERAAHPRMLRAQDLTANGQALVDELLCVGVVAFQR